MAGETVDANVVLTADNSQYDQAMTSSASTTDALANSVDSLTKKLNDLSKSAGRKLIGIAAADVAVITAATAAYAAYEKQMSQLQAQAAILNRTMEGQQRTYKNYEQSVKGLRTEFGVTTREAAALNLQISKMTDNTQGIDRLARTFTQMSNATGESATGLSQSVLNLQRVMGTPQRDTAKYADQLTSLAAGANTSATALADFAAQIGPIGRLIGQSQTEVTGIAAAFLKAGQDGQVGANAYTKMVSDIAYATQQGSPELRRYANLVGMTVEQFNALSGNEKVISIFESLNRMGPSAITELNRLGLDGMRTMRALTAMTQQSGGIRQAVTSSQRAFGDGSVERGSLASMQGVNDELARLKENAQQAAEAFGKTFGGALENTLKVINKLTSAFSELMQSPFGKFAGYLAAIAAPLLALTGGLALFASTLSKIAAVALVARGAPGRGFMEGFRGFAPIRNVGTGGATVFGAAPGTALGPGGAMIAGRGSWLQRWGYNASNVAGGFAGGFFGGGQGGTGAGGPGMISRIAGVPVAGAAWGVRNVAMPAFTPLGFAGMADPTQRQRIFTSPTLAGTFWRGWDQSRGLGVQPGGVPVTGQGGTVLGSQAAQNIRSQMSQQAQAAQGAVNANKSVASATSGLGRQFSQLARDTGKLGVAMASAAGSAALVAGKWTGRTLYEGLGGPLGMLMLAGGVAYAGYKGYQATTADIEMQEAGRRRNFLSAYQNRYGIETPTDYTPSYGDTGAQSAAVSMAEARDITVMEARTASSPGYQFVNELIKNAANEEEAMAGVSAQWETIRRNAEAVNDLTMDWTAKFGRSSAQGMIRTLESGGGELESIASLAGQAANAPRTGFWDTVLNRRSGGVTDERINAAFDAVDDRAAFLKASQGTAEAARYTTEAWETVFTSFADNFGKGVANTDEVDAQFSQAAMKQLFGMDIGVGAAKWAAEHGQGRIEPGMGIEEWLRSQLETDELFWGDKGEKRLVEALKAVGADETLRGDKAIDAIVAAIENPEISGSEQGMTMAQRVGKALGQGAVNFLGSDAMRRYMEAPGSAAALYNAVDYAYGQYGTQGLSAVQIATRTGRLRAEIGDDTAEASQVAQLINERARQSMAFQAPFLQRPAQFRQQARFIGGQMAITPTTNEQAQLQEQDLMTFMGQVGELGQFFQQMLLQRREFQISMRRGEEDFAITRERMEEQYNLSRQRAQEDFHLQRQYQEYDFNLSRERAEFDYQLQRQRGQEAFQRSLRRGQTDFDISRRRQERDFQHQVVLMAEQAAKQMYNIYERLQVQRTSSASYMLVNADDQLRRMQEQSANLERLRGMGLSDQAIQQLGFTDAQNAQQLARFVSEVAQDPNLIKEMNKAIRQRMRAARALVTDESSREWEEFQRQHRIATRRATDDFERSVRRARKDFSIQMNQMEKDYRRQMNRASEDYETAQERQQRAFSLSMQRGAEDYARAIQNMTDDFSKSMNRAQEDMDRMAKTIGGNLEQIFTKAANRLDGHVGKQARSVLKTFRGLDKTLGDEGIEIMTRMAQIFGFKYTPPRRGGGRGDSPRGTDTGGLGEGTKGGIPEGMAAGGVLPGRSVGRDNMHFYSPEHGRLSLAGGEAIMVPEWVDAVGGPQAVKRMNQIARRGFAEGGQIPAPGSWNQHTSGYPWARWAGDINVPGSGDYGNPVRAWKDGIVAAVVELTTSYGKHIRVNHPGSNEQTLYAHLSQIGVTPGASVSRGQMIGRVGNTGNSFGPHLHFEIKGGTGPVKLGGAARGMGLDSILKDRYPEVERAAADVMLNGGLFEDGFWSKKINAYAREVASQIPRGRRGAGLSDAPPTSPGSNQDIVRDAMRSFGWHQWPALYQLVQHESSFNHLAQNPTSTAFGLFQFLDSTWAGVGGHKTSDPHLQALYGMRYIKQRYGNPRGAWDFWQRNNWYANGAVFDQPQMIGVGEGGPEMVLPLNNQGANFIADLFRKTQVGLDSRATNLTGGTPIYAPTSYHYEIDRSTTFSGPITVQANNPQEFLMQLQARQRLQALKQPALGGARS